MEKKENKIIFIKENTCQALEELQATILQTLSIEDRRILKYADDRDRVKLSPKGEDIRRREAAVRKNSNSISTLGAQLSNMTEMDLKHNVAKFFNKGPLEYRYLSQEIEESINIDFVEIADSLQNPFKSKYLNFIEEQNLEVQLLVNNIGAKLSALNNEFESVDLPYRFDVKTQVQEINGIPMNCYDCEQISEIVINHVDSNVRNVVNNYQLIKANINKKDYTRVFEDTGNKEFKESFTKLFELHKLSEKLNNQIPIAISNTRGHPEQLQEQLLDTYSKMNDIVSDMSPVARDQFNKFFEEYRQEQAIFDNENHLDKHSNDLEL